MTTVTIVFVIEQLKNGLHLATRMRINEKKKKYTRTEKN